MSDRDRPNLSVHDLETAIALACHAHAGQRDRAGAPYILHPLRVMQRLGDDATEHERMAAVLHDVAEDTPYSLARLAELACPDPVLRALECLTKREGEPYEAFIERLLPDPIARRVKRADLEDNLDVRRLGSVTPKDTERLERYRAAWRRVTQR